MVPRIWHHGHYRYRVTGNHQLCVVFLPEEWTFEQDIVVNEKAGHHGGVQKIKDDGSVIFADDTYEARKEGLGFECTSFKPQDSEMLAREQIAKFRQVFRLQFLLKNKK